MTKIYVVTQGEYSDYGILGVFSSRRKAERVAELESNDSSMYGAIVEEYELNDESLLRVRIKVIMMQNGDVVSALPVNSAPGFRGFRNSGAMVWIARTEDVERSVKITNEMRTLLVANNLWGDWKGAYALFRSSTQTANKKVD